MNAEYIQILLNKISTIYTEQIWAVTIFSVMCGFVIDKSKYLIEMLDKQALKRGIQGATLFCTTFIVIRFFAYFKYDKILDAQLMASGIHPISNVFSKYIALLSGTIFYITIVFVLCLVTLKILEKEQPNG